MYSLASGMTAVPDGIAATAAWNRVSKATYARPCMQALMHTKAKYLIGQLRSLGFQDWQCAVAIMQHGSHLEACIAFLLEDHITSEEESRAYMVAHALAPPIDVSEELQMLAEAQVPLCSLESQTHTYTHTHTHTPHLCLG